MENIAIIYNPNAGQNRKKFLNRVLTLLGQNNIAKIEQIENIETNSLSIFPDYEEAIHLDGDYYGQWPLTISVSNKAIKLIEPFF